MDLQSSRYRTDVQNKPIQTKDLIPVVNDLEKIVEAIPDNIVEAPFTPDDNPIVAGDTYQEAFEKAQGQINGIGTEITTINGEITQLQNNEYKITYYEVVSGAGGSLTVPTGATINEGEFGSSGNCILSKINVDNKPTFESPKTAGGVIVTASLDPITGVWSASGVYTDPSVALIYSLKINALNYPNLDYDFIIQSEEIDDKTTFVAPLVKDVSKDEVSIPPATTTDDGYLTSTDWNTFNNKLSIGDVYRRLAHNYTPVSGTAVTSEEVLHTLQIDAGIVAAGDMLEWYVATANTSSVNNKTWRMYINTTPNLSGTPVLLATSLMTANAQTTTFSRKLPVLSTTSVFCYGSPSQTGATPYASIQAASTVVAVPNLSSGFYIVITAQKANSGETVTANFSDVFITK